MNYYTQLQIAKHMTPIEILISLVSAITHDLDHPGVNQKFLVETNNHLATLYEVSIMWRLITRLMIIQLTDKWLFV